MSVRCCDQCRCSHAAAHSDSNSQENFKFASACPLDEKAPERIEDKCLWQQGSMRESDCPSQIGLAFTLIRHIEEGVIPLIIETQPHAMFSNHAQRILRRFLSQSPVMVRSEQGEDLLQTVDDADQYLTPVMGLAC